MAQFVSLDAFLNALPAMAAEQAERLRGQLGCVALAVQGREPVAFSLQPDGSVSRADPAAVRPDCTVRAKEEDLLAVVNGALKPAKAFMTGRISVDGNISLLMKIMKLLA